MADPTSGLLQTAPTPNTSTTATPPPLDAQAPQLPAGAVPQPGDATAAQGTATLATPNTYTATPYKVDPSTMTVAGNVDAITRAGSPLMDFAKGQADQSMNERGLLNSSIAEQARQNAVLQTALPIAQQDAATYNQAMTNTANAQNTASQFNAQSENAASLNNSQVATNTSLTNAGQQNQVLLNLLNTKTQGALAQLSTDTQMAVSQLTANNQLLLQTNGNATDMFSSVVKNLAGIAADPNMTPQAKQAATNAQLNMLNQGFKTLQSITTTGQTNVGQLNISSYFDQFAQLAQMTPSQIAGQRAQLQANVDAAQAAMPVWGQNYASYQAPPGPMQSERTAANFQALYQQKFQAYQQTVADLAQFNQMLTAAQQAQPTAA